MAIVLAVGVRPWLKPAELPPAPVAVAPAAPAAVPTAAVAPAPATAPAASVLKTKPSFDVVRVEPDGAYVIAGRADPAVTVALLVDGVTADTEPTNAEGGFAIAGTTPLSPGDHDLTLRATAPNGESLLSDQHVTVIVAANGTDQPVVALADPDAPTRVLQQPGDALEAAVVLIRAVDADAARFSVSGKAASGQTVRIYLDDAPVGTAQAAGTGDFALAADMAVTAGDHRVRADQIRPDGSVAARAEVNFAYAPAALVTPVAAGTPTPEGMRRVVVQKGDNLWKFSRQFYGAGERYTVLYQANRNHIVDPDLIYPGQEFLIPER